MINFGNNKIWYQNMITTLDKYGRIIIPKKLRKHLGITESTYLDIKEDEKRIIIEPIQNEDAVVDKEDLLVYTGNISDEPDDLLNKNRRKRIKKLYNEGNN